MDTAEEIIKWFNNHSRALASLRDEQSHQYNGRVLTLLYPICTRWSSRYLACARLLAIERAVRSLVFTRIDDLVALTSKARTVAETEQKQIKTRELLKTVLEDEFWSALKTYSINLHCLIINMIYSP